jgi:hypothetical protein
MKQCTKCKEHKPKDQFNKNASSKDRLASRCRECEKGIKKNKIDIYSDLYRIF